jgi:electron transfer flavoprotein beta subunit
MNIVVTAKYVPDPDLPGELDGFRLRREGVPGLLDPIDQCGVELAVQLKEALGGRVVLVSMGPAVAEAALRLGLAMGADEAVLVTDPALTGADEAVLVTDPALTGADALVTARVLARAIGRFPFDLVICGAQSSDGSTGTLGAMLAGLLDLPGIGPAKRVEVGGRLVRVRRQMAAGYEVAKCSLPALVAVTSDINVPRFPSFKARVAARSKPLTRLTAADLGLGPDALRVRQAVVAITPAEERSPGEIVVDDGTAVARIIRLLEELGVI